MNIEYAWDTRYEKPTYIYIYLCVWSTFLKVSLPLPINQPTGTAIGHRQGIQSVSHCGVAPWVAADQSPPVRAFVGPIKVGRVGAQFWTPRSSETETIDTQR